MRRHVHSDDADQHITPVYWSSTLTYPRPSQGLQTESALPPDQSLWQNLQIQFQSRFKRPFVRKPHKDLPSSPAHRGATGVFLFTLFLALSADIYRAGNPSVPHRVSENSTVKMIRTNSLTSSSFLLCLSPFSFIGNITWSATVLYI